MKDKKQKLLLRVLYAVCVSWWLCLIKVCWFGLSLLKAESQSLSGDYEKRAWGRCRLRHLVDYIEFRHPHYCLEPGGWLSKQLGVSIIRAANFAMDRQDADLENENPAAVERWKVTMVSALKVEYLLRRESMSMTAAEPKRIIPRGLDLPTETKAAPLDLRTMPVEEFVEVNGHR